MFNRITILTIAAVLLGISGGAWAVRTETFNSSLGNWTDHDVSSSMPGWSNTNNAGGASGAGEFGGLFVRRSAASYPYVADTSMFAVDHTTPLVIKANYQFQDIPDGDRDPHIMMGYIDTATRRCSVFYMQLHRWSDSGANGAQLYLGNKVVAWWTASHTAVVTVDLSYTYNRRTGVATVTGSVVGTQTGTLEVNASAEIDPATADAFGVLCQTAANEEHVGRQIKLFVDDVTYGGPSPETASAPVPEDQDVNIARDVVCTWQAGVGATQHDVYFGEDEFAVSNATTASPEYKGRQSSASFDPEGPITGPEDLESGVTYYWRIDEIAGSTVHRGMVWRFTATTSARAQDPDPAHGAVGIDRSVIPGWMAGVGALSHDVYFGSDKDAVTNADRAWAEFRGNRAGVSYTPPGTLDLGRTYYWRIDELDAYTTHKGDVWEFTMETGKASNPVPSDGQIAPVAVLLAWQPGFGALAHNVYLGLEYETVANATTSSAQYKGYSAENSFDAGTLLASTRYYWRIDEVGESNVHPSLVGPDGAIKGPVWTFVTPGCDILKVDLALPLPNQPGDPSQVDYNFATAKPDWTIWAAQQWYDIYMHDWVNYPNIGGTGINTAISTVYNGEGGLKVYDMCMVNKAGGGAPSGTPAVGPIANSWFYAVDHVNAPRSSIALCLAGMPPGEYWMTSYHNYWEPCDKTVRECTRCGNDYGQGMQFVRAMSMQQANDYYSGAEHDIIPGMTDWAGADAMTGGVTSIADAVNVMPTHVTGDAGVKTSLIKFTTDGSPLIVAYEPAPYQDTGDQYKGPRGILNAFSIQAQEPIFVAGKPTPSDGSANVVPSTIMRWLPGAMAVSHELYIGPDATAVANATKSSAEYEDTLPRGTESYDGRLLLNKTYYWRIDEVGADGTVWPGSVWSFTTSDCQYIDNFEGALEWTGFGGSAADQYGKYVNLSTDKPHAGTKSMEIEYFNTSGFSFSEAGMEFAAAQDWTAGPQTLGLYFRGKAGNVSDRMYLIVEDAAGATAEASHTPDLTNDIWQAWGVAIGDLSGIDLTQVKKVFVGAGDRAGSPSEATGFLYIDDVGLCRGRCVTGPSQDLTGDCLVNFDDHAVKAQTWTGDMLGYKALAEQWLEEDLIWP